MLKPLLVLIAGLAFYCLCVMGALAIMLMFPNLVFGAMLGIVLVALWIGVICECNKRLK